MFDQNITKNPSFPHACEHPPHHYHPPVYLRWPSTALNGHVTRHLASKPPAERQCLTTSSALHIAKLPACLRCSACTWLGIQVVRRLPPPQVPSSTASPLVIGLKRASSPWRIGPRRILNRLNGTRRGSVKSLHGSKLGSAKWSPVLTTPKARFQKVYLLLASSWWTQRSRSVDFN